MPTEVTNIILVINKGLINQSFIYKILVVCII
jgi:hypothetical protein